MFVIGLSTPALNLQSPHINKNEDVHGIYYYASSGMLTYCNSNSINNQSMQKQLIPLHAHDVFGLVIEQMTCINGARVWLVHITVQHTRIASIATPL